ncbi:MAG: hypothetical protein N3A55_01835 [Methylohalobius sp.]|nr:hypothetical protein [Methylohalobius sp.]
MSTKWVVLGVLLAGSFSAFAQPTENWMEWRMRRLDEQLELTPEQKPRVEAVLREQREKMQAVREETRNRIKAILTPEQAARFDKLHREQKERWRQHMRQRLSRP